MDEVPVGAKVEVEFLELEDGIKIPELQAVLSTLSAP